MVISHKVIKNIPITNNTSLRDVLYRLANTGEVHLYIDMKSREYSYYAKRHANALEIVDSSELLMSVTNFQLDEEISDTLYNATVDALSAELLDRIRVLDLEQSSEYTMRELISPVLFRALCLVDDYNNRKIETRVRLTCEKLVSGASGDGPIVYVMSYLNVPIIVIAEAKQRFS